MRRHEVQSTSLASVGYDANARVLEVEFRSGAVYHYHDVPYRIAQGLARAQSIGGYFMRAVRNSFSYERVE